jgi:hypothetical protein
MHKENKKLKGRKEKKEEKGRGKLTFLLVPRWRISGVEIFLHC